MLQVEVPYLRSILYKKNKSQIWSMERPKEGYGLKMLPE